jgi:ribulose bisphosphate carboxylase small subunit
LTLSAAYSPQHFLEMLTMEKTLIQYQNNGMWQTVTTLPAADTQKLLIEMQTVQRIHPGCRVRAIDEAGHLIDILP